MSQALLRVSALRQGDRLELRTLSTHPMEAGRHTNESGQLLAAHFIVHFTVTLNAQVVIDLDCSQGFSANPPLGFRLRGVKAGDQLLVAWVDILGTKASQTLVVA